MGANSVVQSEQNEGIDMNDLIDMDDMMNPVTIVIAMIKNITEEIEITVKIENSPANTEETTSEENHANIVADRNTEVTRIVNEITIEIKTEEKTAITVEEMTAA